MLGVTVEFSKMEGLAYDPARGSVYLAMSTVRRGMEDMADKGEPSAEYDQPAAAGGNDVRLPYNDCGCGAPPACRGLHSCGPLYQ